MTNAWTHKNGPVTMVIDRDALSFVLETFAPDLTDLAERVAEGAKKALPEPWMRNSIRVKAAGGFSPNNQGIWRLKMRGRRYGSGTGERLMRGVEVPVALVTNNSRLAMTWEYGAIAEHPSIVFRRKGSRKIAADAVKGDYEAYNRQWSPLLTGARAAGGGRLVAKFRQSRGG